MDDLSVSGPIQPPAPDDTSRRQASRKRERPRPPRRRPAGEPAAEGEERPVAKRHEGNLDVIA